MLCIIIFHVCLHGLNGAFTDDDFSAKASFSRTCASFLGNFGNWCFMLISGWFLCGAKFKLQRALKLWFQMAFYSVSACVFLHFFGKVSKTDVFHAFFPLRFNYNWYATSHFAFLFCAPFCDLLVSKLDREKHFALVAFCVVFSFFTRFFKAFGGNLFLFITAFFVASFVKKYEKHILAHTKLNFAVGFLLFFGENLWRFAIRVSAGKIAFVAKHLGGFLYGLDGMDMFFTFAAAFFVFCGFAGAKIRPSRFINEVAAGTFAVYLIHDNSRTKQILWQNVFHLKANANSPHLVLRVFAVSFLVFAFGVTLDFIRRKIIAFAVRRFAKSS